LRRSSLCRAGLDAPRLTKFSRRLASGFGHHVNCHPRRNARRVHDRRLLSGFRFHLSAFRLLDLREYFHLMTGHGRWHAEDDRWRRGSGPVCCRAASDDPHVVERFLRQLAAIGAPRDDAPRAGVVGRRGQTEIAELLKQRSQETARRRQRLTCIERILQAEHLSGLRHELRDALRPRATYCAMIKLALLPKEIGKESDRKLVVARDIDKQRAEFLVRENRRAIRMSQRSLVCFLL